MAAETSSMQHVDLYEIILLERNIEDMTLWARVVALPCLVLAVTFVFAAWLEFFSGAVAGTLPGCFGALSLCVSLYLPRLTMLAFQAVYFKTGKRPLQWSLRIMWSVVGISLWLAMVSSVWSVNYPGVLLPFVFGLSPGQSLESFREQTRHSDSLVLHFTACPLGNHLTILIMFGVFAACVPHLFITSLSLPPVMAAAITLLFLTYCCVCAVLAIRQSFPHIMPFCPHIIYMFLVAAFVHVRHLVATIEPLQWNLSPLSKLKFLPDHVVASVAHCFASLANCFSRPLNRFMMRIAIALVSCSVFWAMGSKGIRFFVDAVFIIGYSTIIFRCVISSQGFLFRPNLFLLFFQPYDSSHKKTTSPRTGGYSLRRPQLANILTLLSSIAISLPVQFLPLDWLPCGRYILNAIGDDLPPDPGLMLFAFVLWSVLGPMLLLRDLRLSVSALFYIYGGNLLYVNVSVFFKLRAMAASTPHPPFVLIDVVLESLTTSVCLLLLLSVSHFTMQVCFSVFAFLFFRQRSSNLPLFYFCSAA
jgi:hypothetical protein